MEPIRKRQRHSRCMPFPPSLSSWSCVDSKCDPSLYPVVLLHLGYTLSQRDKELDTNMMVILCRHWNSLTQVCALDIELELELAHQVLVECDDLHVIRYILNILSTVLSRYHQQQGMKIAPHIFEGLTKALMCHIDDYKSITSILKILAKICPFGKISYTAACVISERGTDSNLDVELFNFGRKMHDYTDDSLISISQMLQKNQNKLSHILKFLWALSNSRKYACLLSTTSPEIISFLHHHQQSQTFVKLVQNYGPTPMITLHLQNSFLRCSSERKHINCPSDDKCKLETLLHCMKFLRPQPEFIDIIQRTALLQEGEIAIVATEILSQLFERGKTELSKNLLHILKNSNVAKILERILKSLGDQVKTYNKPQLLSIATKVSELESPNSYLQHYTVTILFHLTKNDPTSWVDIARDSNIVSTLLQVIGSHPKHISHDRAIDVLWRISTPITNRRILALTAGLLPSLIRAVRNLPEGQQQAKGYDTRAKWKERIMNLASLM